MFLSPFVFEAPASAVGKFSCRLGDVCGMCVGGISIYYNNVVLFFKSVHHSHNLLHNHLANRPWTNSHFKAHMYPILPIQSLFSNSSSSSRKFPRKRFLSCEFHVTFHIMGRFPRGKHCRRRSTSIFQIASKCSSPQF